MADLSGKLITGPIIYSLLATYSSAGETFPPETMLPYVDPEWREAVANVAKVPHRYLNRPAFCPSPAFGLPGQTLPSTRNKAREEIVWNAEQMRRELDGLAIDAGILFPDNFLKISAIASKPSS